MRFAFRNPRVVAVGAIVLGLASCDEQTLTYLDPVYRVGFLRGYVKVAGEPRVVTVGAREMEYPGRVIARTQCASDGSYELELPADRYRMEINPDYNGHITSDTFHVVQVEPGNQRYDLLFGHLVLRLAVPESMQGIWVTARVGPSGFHAVDALQRQQLRGPVTEFTFDYLEPGMSHVSLWTPGHESYWLPGTYDEDAAQEIDVLVDRETLVEAELTQLASIAGSVTGSWLQAGAGSPTVEAHTLDNRTVARGNPTADGSYRLHVFIAEPVKVRVGEWDGVEQWIGGSSFESATVFDLHAGENIGGADLVESGILVRFEGPGTFSVQRAHFRITDGSGWEFELDRYDPFAITNLRPGRYYLHASGTCNYSPQPWAPQWYAGAQSLETATPIDLGDGQLARITMQLEQGGGIDGRVLFADPNIRALHVAVFDTAGIPLCADPQWTEDGKFRFRGLAAGDYLVAVLGGESRWWYPGTWVRENATVIHVADAQTVTGIDWYLEPQ